MEWNLHQPWEFVGAIRFSWLIACLVGCLRTSRYLWYDLTKVTQQISSH